MNDLTPVLAASPLRQRLIDDMTMRRFSDLCHSPKTVRILAAPSIDVNGETWVHPSVT